MKQGAKRAIGRCFGSTTVGARGQMVIPAEARKELGIDLGTKLLVFGHFHGRALVFLKVEAVEELLDVMSHRVDEFSRLLKETKTAHIENESN